MTQDIWTDAYIQDLSEEDLKSFQEIVLKDVKNKSFNEIEKSILVGNPDLWLYSLRVIRREIELQLSQHKTNLKMKLKDLQDENAPAEKITDLLIAEESWRNNAMKFLNSIERKTLYVKLVIDQEERD
jgi:hypothetical protein